MRRQIILARVLGLSLLAATTLTSCKGQRTSVALRETQEMVVEMETLHGEKHAKDKLESIRKLISDANSMVGSDVGQAFVLAKQAQQTAEGTLIEVRAAEATDLWNQAEEEIRVADRNGAPRIDPARYEKILLLRTQATESRNKNENEKVIQYCQQIKQEVDSLLSGLKTEAERKQIEATNKLNDLRANGGPIYAPEKLVEVQDIINNAQKVMTEERDYVLASNNFDLAKREAENGLEVVNREKSRQILDQIEDKLGVAYEEGAREYVPEEYDNVVRLHDQLVQEFVENRFSKVLLSGGELMPRAELLVFNTKAAASDARVKAIKREIDTLVEGGAREYLPGRVELLEEFHVKASEKRQVNTVEAFDEVKAIARDAEEEADKINRAFADLATEAIRLAANRLDTTEQVYTRAEQIFPPNPNVTADMKPFEESKEARRNQLGSELDQSRQSLVLADQRMNEQKYRNAILLAEEQQVAADRLLGEIYHLVADYAVIELNNLISRYERDGARIYAADELERSVADLERVKKAINEEQYLLATELSSAARADIELMAQRISGRAVDDIREARESFVSAASDKTRRYSADLLVRVQELIDQAEQELQAQRLKLAVETANQATQTAREAVTQANRMAAEDALTQARQQIQRSESARATLYGGREMESAKKLIDSAESLYASSDYVKAEELASSSAEKASQAFYKKVNDAEAAIADAKAVGGWEFDNKRLSEASANARLSRQALEKGNYGESESLADSAASTARAVAADSKLNNYETAVRRIVANLEEGRQQGINYFQVGDSIAVRRKLAEIQTQWSLDKYDYIIAELQKLEGQLRETLDTTDDLVDKVAEQQTARLNSLVESGAADYSSDLVSDARQNLKYALIDYRKGLYKSAHSSLDRAITQINEIEMRRSKEQYAAMVEGMFNEYNEAQYKFRNVLSLGPGEMKSLAFGSFSRGQSVAVSGQYTPAQFREAVERLYSEVIEVHPPAGMEKVHESVVEAFNRGRIASIHFEKLIILNEVSNEEAEAVINAAYETMNQSNQVISQLKRDFFHDEVRFRLVSASNPGTGRN